MFTFIKIININQQLTYRYQNISNSYDYIKTTIDNDINTYPYLLLFNNNIYLANDCNEISKNIFISYVWNTEEYNFKNCSYKKTISPNIFNIYGDLIHSNPNSNINIIHVHNKKFISLLNL